MTNHSAQPDTQQFIASYELLQLLQWLFDHEQEALKRIINRALHQGLGEHLVRTSHQQGQQSTEELQQNIVDFFSLLETLLHEVIHEDTVKTVLQHTMLPAIKHLDTTLCDQTTLAMSIAKATTASTSTKQEVLFKELLKRWKPNKKLSSH